MAYVSRSAVLKEAGQLHIERGEIPSGTIDSANKNFTVNNLAIQDRDYDDTVDANDVDVYVDGAAVSIDTVTAGSGLIVLNAAPATSTTVTVDYAHCRIDQTSLDEIIEEVEEVINTRMSSIATLTIPYATVPKTIRLITRLYAAGLLMTQEYGLSSVTDETVKEGNRKIKLATKLLGEYYDLTVSNASDDSNADVVRSSTDTRIFEEHSTQDGWQPIDEQFKYETL